MPTDPCPFDGLKVLDCASGIAGPAAATMLSDFGAGVIRFEPPAGDPMHSMSRLPGVPPSVRNGPWEPGSRDKRSLVLDLKQPEGQADLHRLTAPADAVITHVPLPVRPRSALHPERSLALHPRLVYASHSARGESGPEADKAGLKVTACLARTGLKDRVCADDNALREAPCAQGLRWFDQCFTEQDLARWRRLLEATDLTFSLIGTLADIPHDDQMRQACALVPGAHGCGSTVANAVRLAEAW